MMLKYYNFPKPKSENTSGIKKEWRIFEMKIEATINKKSFPEYIYLCM